MRSAWNIIGTIFIIGTVMLCCDSHLVQRASSDYFCLDEGNWWFLLSASDTLLMEVESVDTLLQRECIPVNSNGYVDYLILDDDAVRQYVRMVHYFSGEEHTIIESYVVRIALPLVDGNVWSDRLLDSLYIFDQWVRASYYVKGEVLACEYSEAYGGDVYSIRLETITSYDSADSVSVDSSYVTEEYAPNLGIIRVIRTDGDYLLADHELQ